MANTSLLSTFSIIKLSGEQSHSFLQGQVTCDVNQLADADWKAGANCNAKGKAWSTFIAFEHNKDIYLIMTKESAAVTFAELNKYGVFSKTDITDETGHFHIYGSDDVSEFASLANDADNTSISFKSIKLADNHFIVISEKAITGASNDASAWWHNEILSGRAHLFEKTSGEYVPQMMNLQALDYISFNKGCYMGQEMVARMKYLGKNKRALYLAETDEPIELEAGDDVFKEMNGNKRASGKIINSVVYNGKTVMQMVLPNDTTLDDIIYLHPESEQRARLLALPYSLDQD